MDRCKWSLAILAAAALMAGHVTTAFGKDDCLHHDGAEHHAASKRGGAGPLIEEMVKLDAVFREVVSAVALEDGRRVHEALEKMHGAMERTHEGVSRGTVVLRKNAGRLKEFVDLDRRFHARLEDLAHAAHRNDGAAMASLAKELLDRCIACHKDFRQP